MEYSYINPSSLGGSQIQGTFASSLKKQKYTINNSNANTDVVFQQNDNYLQPLMDIDDTSSNYYFSNNDSSNNDSSNNDSPNENNGSFHFVNDNINTFFIGSITVVGLFVLFRLLQKNK